MTRDEKAALALLRDADQRRAATGQLTVVDLTHLPSAAVDAAVEREYGMAADKRDAYVRRWHAALRDARKARGLARMLAEKGASSEGQLARAAGLQAEAAALAAQLGLTVAAPGEDACCPESEA